MKKITLLITSMILIVILSISISSCAKHEHNWSEPTFDSPSTCSCGATSGTSVNEMISGSWKQSSSGSSYMYIKFSGSTYTANHSVLDGGLFKSEGTIEASGNTLTLKNTSGKTYATFIYSLEGENVKLTDSEGSSWIKIAGEN